MIIERVLSLNKSKSIHGKEVKNFNNSLYNLSNIRCPILHITAKNYSSLSFSLSLNHYKQPQLTILVAITHHPSHHNPPSQLPQPKPSNPQPTIHEASWIIRIICNISIYNRVHFVLYDIIYFRFSYIFSSHIVGYDAM